MPGLEFDWPCCTTGEVVLEPEFANEPKAGVGGAPVNVEEEALAESTAVVEEAVDCRLSARTVLEAVPSAGVSFAEELDLPKQELQFLDDMVRLWCVQFDRE